MSAHSVLRANDAYAAWLSEGEVLAERRDVLNRQVLAARQAEAKRVALHDERIREAVEAGQPVPRPPGPEDTSHLDAALSIQQTAEQQHRDRRTAVMAEAHATGAWQGLVDRERGRQARLRPIAEELAAIHREAQQDGAQAAELLRARDLMDGLTVHPSRAERMNTRPSVQDVLDAATAATSLLDPEPLTAHGPPRIVPDLGEDDGNHAGKARAEATMSRLGYQHGGSFGVQRDDRTGSARSVRDATL